MNQPHLRLPTSLTSFVGRTRELARVHALIQAASMLTVTGPGGSGKTRLVLQTAADLAPHFADGVYWCDLTQVSDPNYVPQVIVGVLARAEQPNRSATETALEFIRARQLLLVLDNCEHVLDACAAFVAAILAECPNAKILATSLQPLGLPQEKIYPVPPLALPESNSNLAELSQCDAIRLFAARAGEAYSDFALTSDNAPTIDAICQRLDGLPLAIELAAARVKLLTVEQIAERLDDTFQLLTRGKTDALARHQTLRATMDWAHSFLSAPEQILLRRLAVFAGAFTFDMVEAVGASKDEPNVLDLLTGLVDKSFVTLLPRESSTPARYRLLETIRQYAREKLETSGEAASLRTRALAWFADDAERIKPLLNTQQQTVLLNQLKANLDNLRSALRWACTSHQAEPGLHLIGVLWQFWYLSGYWTEGVDWCHELLALTNSPTRAAARAHHCAGVLAYRQNDMANAQAHLEASIAAFQSSDDSGEVAHAINWLGTVVKDKGDYARATVLFEEALAISRDQRDDFGIAFALYNLASVARDSDTAPLNRFARAKELLATSLSVSRRAGNLAMASFALARLGNLARNTGDATRAEQCFLECLELRQQIGDEISVTYSLLDLANLAIDLKQWQRAQAHLESSYARFRQVNDTPGMAYALDGLGIVALAQADAATAAAHFRDALAYAQPKHRPLDALRILENLIDALAQQGEARTAARYLAATTTWRETMRAPAHPSAHARHAETATRLRAQLGDAAFDAIAQSARALSLEQVVAEAMGIPSPHVQSQPTPSIIIAKTPRPDLRVYLLGTTRVVVGARTLTPANWKYTKARELFFYLLVNSSATKAQIGLDLWQDASPEQLRNIFHRALHYCRQAIAHPEWILFSDDVYRFDRHANMWCDLDEFETKLAVAPAAHSSIGRAQAIANLAEATRLWRGDFLADLDAGEWVIFKREALRQQFLQALLDLGSLYLADARYADAVTAFQRALSFDNYLEIAQRELMRCYARQGDVARAVRHFGEWRQLMRDELGAEPAAETVLLYDRLRRGDDV